MIIAQISDTHITLDAPDADQRIQDFQSVIEDINALDPAPDLIIHAGDIVHNGRKDEYAQAIVILSRANAPVYGMVGNKDNRICMREAFADYGYFSPGSDFIDYSIDGFPIELIVLDTLHTNSNKGDFCEKRMRNLIDMTNTQTTKPIAVFMHHPPCEITVGPDPIHFESVKVMSELRNALHRSGRVISIFSGHVHRSTMGYVGDIPVKVMSAVATTLRRGEYPDHMKTCPTYSIHRFDPDCGFVTETRIVRAL